MSTTADATHFNTCSGLIELKDSYFEGMGDDAGNFKTLYLTVDELEDDHTFVGAHNLKLNVHIRPGDRVHFCTTDDLLPYAQAKVEKVEFLGEGRQRIVLSDPLPTKLKAGDVVANISRLPKVRVSNCTVRNNRARGFLLQTHDAIVEDCTFENCTGSGIFVMTEVVFFFEAIGTRNITIRNNRFENCGYTGPMGEGVLAVYAYLADFAYAPKPGVHRDITLENNVIRGADNCGIFITSTDGIRIAGNTIENVSRKPTNDKGDAAIYISGSRNVEITGNTIDSEAQGPGFKTPVKLGPGCEEETIGIKNNTGF
jgi:parallel beta-helix repeat protein